MSRSEGWELLARDAGEGRIALAAPAVGLWADPPALGARLGPGDAAGFLLVLGRAHALRVPAGCAGTVVSAPPELRHAPRGYGETLLLLDAGAARAAPAAAPPPAAADGLRAPQAGRFWRRPAPGAPPFVEEGAELGDGQTYGLLEVMKTFQPLKHRPEAGRPARLRRWLAEDGAEVAEGQPLAELG